MDFDGDGEKDLITGCFEGGMYLVQGLGDGEFAPPTPVLDKEDNILRLGQYWSDEERKWTGVEDSEFKEYLGICGFAVDFDEDGDLDLVLGSNEGALFWRENVGTRNEPQYATESVQLKSGEEPLTTDSHAMPFVIDWDGDGLFDLLSGRSDGGVVWFKNVGKKGEPIFAAATELIEPGRENADGSASVGKRSQVTVGDHNGDGLLDIIVGDYSSRPPDMSKVSEEDRQRIEELDVELIEVRQTMRELQTKIQQAREKEGENKEVGEEQEETEKTADKTAELQAEYKAVTQQYSELFSERRKIMPSRTLHGFVWLFQQKRSSANQ